MLIEISFFLCYKHLGLKISCVLRRYMQKKVYWGLCYLYYWTLNIITTMNKIMRLWTSEMELILLSEHRLRLTTKEDS